MRQIVLDTETTGLDPESGHRIIEIGCVEIRNRRISDFRFHQYLNPEREIDEGAINVHGITLEDLRHKPLFADIAAEFIAFVGGAELIIHNAPFDVGFLDYELGRLDGAWNALATYCTVFDTLTLARELHPGQRNNLDALCKRYEVDNRHRDLHGALLDAELLADVYLAMTGGQVDLILDDDATVIERGDVAARRGQTQRSFRVVKPSTAELADHAAWLTAIEQASETGCLWIDRWSGED